MPTKRCVLLAVLLLTLSCSNDTNNQVGTEPVPNNDVLKLGNRAQNELTTTSEQLGTPTSTAIPVELGEPFELEPGDKAVVVSSGLQLTFNEVLFSNRCPADVSCIWQGEAAIGVTVADEGTTSDLSLKIDGLTGDLTGPTQHTISYGGYSFTLLNLDPYPLDHPPDGYEPGPDRARLLILAD